HAGYGLTTGASAALHSNATNARRRKPLVGAVRSLGTTNWVSQPRTPSSLRAAFGRRPSRVGRLFEDLARRHPITFARPRTPLGMGMPSAVAVFGLVTSSYLFRSVTGRSAGGTPRRILSTSSAQAPAAGRIGRRPNGIR